MAKQKITTLPQLRKASEYSKAYFDTEFQARFYYDNLQGNVPVKESIMNGSIHLNNPTLEPVSYTNIRPQGTYNIGNTTSGIVPISSEIFDTITLDVNDYEVSSNLTFILSQLGRDFYHGPTYIAKIRYTPLSNYFSYAEGKVQLVSDYPQDLTGYFINALSVEDITTPRTGCICRLTAGYDFMDSHQGLPVLIIVNESYKDNLLNYTFEQSGFYTIEYIIDDEVLMTHNYIQGTNEAATPIIGGAMEISNAPTLMYKIVDSQLDQLYATKNVYDFTNFYFNNNYGDTRNIGTDIYVNMLERIDDNEYTFLYILNNYGQVGGCILPQGVYRINTLEAGGYYLGIAYTYDFIQQLDDKFISSNIARIDDIPTTEKIIKTVNSVIEAKTKKDVTIQVAFETEDSDTTSTVQILETYNNIYNGTRKNYDVIYHISCTDQNLDNNTLIVNNIQPTLIEGQSDTVNPTWTTDTEPYDITYVSFIYKNILYKISITWDTTTYENTCTIISTIPLNLIDASEVAM